MEDINLICEEIYTDGKKIKTEYRLTFPVGNIRGKLGNYRNVNSMEEVAELIKANSIQDFHIVSAAESRLYMPGKNIFTHRALTQGELEQLAIELSKQ